VEFRKGGSVFGQGRRRAHLIALEPRMMFDAAVAATTEKVADAAVADKQAAATTDTNHADVSARDSASATAASASHEIIFIDTSVPDYQQLAQQWAGRGEVVLIDSSKDGIAQMQATLATESNVSAIHIVSHGQEGAFFLGTTRVDEASIDGALAGSLAAIGRAIEPGGDILIYGCDFAEGADGQRALDAFAHATGRDVAASTDLTGASDLGGDWTLEAHDGTIEARSLDATDWHHTLVADNPIPISVQADSLTVKDGNGNQIVTGSTGYGSDNRSADVGVGATAVWANAATYNGHAIDLKATVVAISTGDAVRFNRPGIGGNANNATFLLRDLTAANDATVSIQWQLIDETTGQPLAVDVRFTISDIDGIGGQANTRESVSTSTDHLAYFSHETGSDVAFTSSLDQVTASGTQNENPDTSKPTDPKSDATFDWAQVSSFTLNYKLTTNSVTTMAQFYQDGTATQVYANPIYTSIPRLDLDSKDLTATGNDAHFTYTEQQTPISVVTPDVKVSNPMDINSIKDATVVLTNAKAGDVLSIGTLPSNITAAITQGNGTITVKLTGLGSESDYDAALRAVMFANTSDAPDTTQRVLNVSFENADLTSAVAVSRIDITPVNDPPVVANTLPARDTQDSARVVYQTADGFSDPDGDTLRYSATGLPAGLAINATTGAISGKLDHSASQVNGGVYTVTVTATDPSNTSTSQSFTITVTNPPPVAVDDNATTAEDTPVRINVLANDSDPDGDTISVVPGSVSAQHGIVVRNADNTITYTPDANYNGQDLIAYTITDGQGGTSSAVVHVKITPVNDPPAPVGSLPQRATVDSATVSWATAGGFTDVDGDTLHYTASGLPAGLSIDPTTGIISGTLDHQASQPNGGHYSVTVTATDPSGATGQQVFVIDVSNPAPTASDDRATTHVDTPVTIAPLANDSDPDGDALAVTTATAAHGAVTINADGTILYTPNAGFSGTDTIDYSISDGNGGTAHAVVTVLVTDTPPAGQPIGTQRGADGSAVTLPLGPYFTDADGDTLSYSATGLPAGLSIDPATGTISGTINRSASQANGGVYDITVTANDGHGGTSSEGFRWIVTNPAPIARNDSASGTEDQSLIIAPLANDSDPDGDPLSIVAAAAGHGSVAINPDGTITYTPNANFNGTDTIAYTISDGQGGTASATITVTVAPVNDPPATEGLPGRYDVDATTVSLPVGPAFSDVDGDPLTYTASGLPAGLSIDPATGTISGTIANGSSHGGTDGAGHYSVTVTATDPSGAAVSTSFTWTVGDHGPAPADDRGTTPEDTSIRVDVLANDTDPDNLAFSLDSATATHGSVTISNGALLFTPDANFNGTATIYYTVIDTDGNRASATATITVTPVNDAPTARAIPNMASQDSQAGIDLAAGSYFFDADGDALHYVATGLPAGLSLDPATGRISGTMERDASQVAGGVYHVVITATDPSGASASTAFDWAVTNPAPHAQNDSATTPENHAVTIAVLANDSDPDGDPLSVVEAHAAHGSVAINPDGTLTYTPARDFSGTDLIVYTLSDGNGGYSTADVIVTVPKDAPPVARDDTATTPAGQGTDIPVLANDSDAEGDPLTVTGASAASGLVSINADGTLHYVPRPGFVGTDSIVYTVSDGHGGTASARVTVTVSDPAPLAQDDVARTTPGTAVTIPVLANDSDAGGDALRITSATAGHGTVTINPDGTLTYTPAAGYAGTDSILYAITNGQGGTASAHVAMTVADPSPVARNDAARTAYDRPVTIAVLGNDSADAGATLSVTSAIARHGTVTINADGTLSYTPAPGFKGRDTIDYAISDGRGGTATAQAFVDVVDGRGSDLQTRLGFGLDRGPAVAPHLAGAPLLLVGAPGGVIGNPFGSLLTVRAVNAIRSLDGTRDLSGDTPIEDAAEAARSLRNIGEIDGRDGTATGPIGAEVERLERLSDFRDIGDRLFDHRWDDLQAKPRTGFSSAGVQGANVMMQTLVEGGAIYLDVRDTAPDKASEIRSIDVRLANGETADWIHVDASGAAIIEPAADLDELHLVVTVTRRDGTHSRTPIVIQRATGEIEIDRQQHPHAGKTAARPLHATLQTPHAQAHAAAAHLHHIFK
jgi:hypothetical protein